ncbi:MAG TPA: DUF4105 domain-containing protein [Burkholderiales bacterium]|nr:DUF4105 domain-containing protein [Burkholderiales bacterium]
MHFLLIVAALLAPLAALGAEEAYLAQLVARARELRLAERPEWRKLLHYEPDLIGGGLHGLLDNRDFYNSPQGKTRPQAELEATLASFFSDVEETPRLQNPQCAFIARRAWLDEELEFDPVRLPLRDCPRFREWHAALNAQHLTLVFASAYLNNPSSMYGHTLLRIDARDQDERTRLLAYAVNSAATTDEKNGLAFAIQGLIGGYPGTFSILPYYLKVREYSDLENRDLWEYELSLRPDELERVLRHLWELLPAYYQYYFFDENCSYHLLGLLQVARPDLQLTAPFRWWALPIDTVRAIAAQPGLVARTVYRPANATIIGARLGTLSEEERGIANNLSLGRIPSGDALRGRPGPRAAAILETSYDYVNYRRATGKPDVPDPARLARELLVARSELNVGSQAPAVDAGTRPDQGHATSRIALGAGRRDSQSFQELSFHPTYHEVMDPEAGYVRGAQIEFFDTALRHYADGKTRLERFVPADILSLSPRGDFFQPRSWRVAGGWHRSFVRNGSEPLVAFLDGGAGAAWSDRGGRSLFYALAETALRANRELDGGYGVGAGARVGAMADLAPRWRANAYVAGVNYFVGESDQPRAIGLQQRFTLGRDSALRFDLERRREAGRQFASGMLSLQLYF